MLPLAVLLAVVLGASPALTGLSIAVGVVAALVQGLGLVRWPFAVPELARRYVAAPDGPDGDATRGTVEVVFATLHRLLGVGVGEHLGYLFTGSVDPADRRVDPVDRGPPRLARASRRADRPGAAGRRPRVRRAE